ncbi:MAG: hypothetical protein KGO96_04905 [Elusimicrobia bacterium]|nr:hypothetical protein [Elusimicrobiota bacterium]MDE2236422.1 hypothetical protein [Elusimicrobiota bacterium]MDE2425230.1 hypothetical protein [Elusimicrobiota bacterium]
MSRAALLLLAMAAPLSAATERAAGLLPAHRIVTYYGNPLSKRMGVLGESPPDEMLAQLERAARQWQKADPKTKVWPGLELVATVASDWPGPDGLYRTRMDSALIEKVCSWAQKRHWLVILDIQVGRSSVRAEVERLLPFLKRPYVHLALDPEFEMRHGLRPGARIGSSDAEDVNVATLLLSRIVERYHLPPKLLLVHRFTYDMLTRYKRIRLNPNVQVAVVMDGFGAPGFKRRAYNATVAREPVEFTGVKLFYKNDKPLMSPSEVLRWRPAPNVIIYQ